MVNKTLSLMGIGSEFRWMSVPNGPFLSWPDFHLFLALGRDAVLLLWKEKGSKNSDRYLFIPDYFCPEIYKFWENNGIAIKQYRDDPRWEHPDWTTLTPDNGDFVLAVNYFGVKSGAAWKEWYKKNPQVFLIEDHSHDPFSVWAQSSSADYAFASIRKSFSIPDGAILWSPRCRPLPPEPKNQNWSGSALKLTGMILKKDYFDKQEANPALREGFRKFQVEGEKLLSKSVNLRISPWSRYLILNGFPKDWRIQRGENVRLLLKLLKKDSHYNPLFLNWPLGNCPFNVVLVFKTKKYRDSFRSLIISEGIFTPVHWALNSTNSNHALDLSERILTIPADQRYNKGDIYNVVEIIKKVSNLM